jgi:hypothetical protein
LGKHLFVDPLSFPSRSITFTERPSLASVLLVFLIVIIVSLGFFFVGFGI